MKSFKTCVCAILIITLFTSPGFSFNEASRDISGYRIGPENVLQIDVYYGRDRELSRKVRVSSTGRITFPLLGEVDVAGLSIAELEQKLTDLLDRDYLVNPQVSVFIENYSTVSILGQVKEPGSFEIKGSLTLIELISLAGGFTKIAATNDVRIMRTRLNGSKTTIKVRANDIINRGREEDDVSLEPGDIITVPESFF
jgi:protein involved in polysaccharide export with SLBB domain